MSLSTRILIAAGVIMTGHGLLTLLAWQLTPAAAQVPDYGVSAVPDRLGGWKGEKVDLDEYVVVATGSNQMINRIYRDSMDRPLGLNIGIWTDNSTFPHAPELCYTTAGWDLVNTTTRSIAHEGENPIAVRILDFRRSGDRITVGYWCQFGENIVFGPGKDQLRAEKIALRGRVERYPPLVKVTMHATGGSAEARSLAIVEFSALVWRYTRQMQ